jgi:hypothetical protein
MASFFPLVTPRRPMGNHYAIGADPALFLINRTLLKDRGPTLRVRRFHTGDREKFHGKPAKAVAKCYSRNETIKAAI